MINEEDYKRVLNEHGIEQISQANIRQCVAVSKAMEPVLGEPFVHLEFGVPDVAGCAEFCDELAGPLAADAPKGGAAL